MKIAKIATVCLLVLFSCLAILTIFIPKSFCYFLENYLCGFVWRISPILVFYIMMRLFWKIWLFNFGGLKISLITTMAMQFTLGILIGVNLQNTGGEVMYCYGWPLPFCDHPYYNEYNPIYCCVDLIVNLSILFFVVLGVEKTVIQSKKQCMRKSHQQD